MSQTRRDFLKTSALGVSVSFFAPKLLMSASEAAAFTQGKVLVVLQLSGGNDCLNTFIPYTDSRYRSMRPNLAIADSSILKVDSRLGFHPSMARLATLYQKGKFSFINQVGFASLDRSHFRCRDVWQTGIDAYGQTQSGTRGWLGRYADLYLGSVGSPLATVNIGTQTVLGVDADSVLPTTLASAESFDILTDPAYPADRASYLSAIKTIYGSSQSLVGDAEYVRDQGEETLSAVDLMKAIPAASATATYPASPLGGGFKLAARIIAGNVGTHAIWITEGGFDTHNAQAATHTQLLTDVSESLGAFYDDLVQRGLSDKVLVVAWSEFGRRLQENASAGTDHGKAGTVFLLGDGIKGGTFYGDAPDLGDLDSGDLKTDIDFRSVYATIIRDWYGNDPDPVLNGSYENLGFMAREVSRRRAISR
jgi:uncharacterized protein (DUF1501 family)